jgi:hypothetical protein
MSSQRASRCSITWTRLQATHQAIEVTLASVDSGSFRRRPGRLSMAARKDWADMRIDSPGICMNVSMGVVTAEGIVKQRAVWRFCTMWSGISSQSGLSC